MGKLIFFIFSLIPLKKYSTVLELNRLTSNFIYAITIFLLLNNSANGQLNLNKSSSGNNGSINPEQSETSINIFSGLGLFPFKLNVGVGYSIYQNTEINIQYSGMFMPPGLDVDVFSLGMRFHEKESETIYSMAIGGCSSQKFNAYSLDGVCLEGSIGYLIETPIGFYFMPALKTGEIIRHTKKSYWIIGIDLVIGWYIK